MGNAGTCCLCWPTWLALRQPQPTTWAGSTGCNAKPCRCILVPKVGLLARLTPLILGGDQRGAFRVAAKNIGTVPVEIRERPKNGGIFGKAILAPGQRGALRFLAGSTAVLLNPSRTAANMDLTITGDTNLSMTYKPAQQTTIPPETPDPTHSSDSK